MRCCVGCASWPDESSASETLAVSEGRRPRHPSPLGRDEPTPESPTRRLKATRGGICREAALARCCGHSRTFTGRKSTAPQRRRTKRPTVGWSRWACGGARAGPRQRHPAPVRLHPQRPVRRLLARTVGPRRWRVLDGGAQTLLLGVVPPFCAADIACGTVFPSSKLTEFMQFRSVSTTQFTRRQLALGVPASSF